MMKKIIGSLLLILVILISVQTAFGDSAQSKTFYGIQEVSLAVTNHDERKVLVFPENPLEFKSKVIWDISFEEKKVFNSKNASINIEIIDKNGKSETIKAINPKQNESGEFTLQPGQVCRLTLYAGKYATLFSKYGAKIAAHFKYQKSQVTVTATEMNSPGRFKLNVVSLPAANWNWTLPDGNMVINNPFETSFINGLAVIQLSNPQNRDSFQFDLQVPEPVEANPSISPLEGYEDLTVRSFGNIINHYQSTSKCIWDFGDKTPIETSEQPEHTYHKPGVYQVKLKIINSLGPVIEKNWEVLVRPFTIKNNASVTPERGPIPLTIYFKADPIILGTKPTSIQYLWDFGDGSISKLPSGEHVYPKVGDYPIQLTIMDKNHPELKIEPWTDTVTVTPPILTLTADASRWFGSIPLRVKFWSNLKIEGGPTEVEYDWDFNDGTYSSETSPIHTFTDPGRYLVRLLVRDRIYGTVVTKQFTIDVKPPALSLKVTASQSNGIIPLSVNFTPILDIDGGPTDIEYYWDFNDGASSRFFTSSQVNHIYTQPGIYWVTVTARDRIYHSAETSRIKIEVKTPAISSRSIITPLTGNAPLQILGMGNADVKGYPSKLEYSWYIDGQRYSFDRDFRYLLTKPGTYKVSVTIVDTLPGHTGRDTQSWNVVVQSDPAATATPPVIDNTPTPAPSPTQRPTPTPSLSPTPTPVPKDTKSPELTVALSPNKLVPPNHKMIQITAAIQVKDDQDPDPEIRLISITCNQTIDPKVDISGASFGTDDRSFFLRAERDGIKHEDRVYSVTYSASDRSGNSKMVTSTVIVPFNERDQKEHKFNISDQPRK